MKNAIDIKKATVSAYSPSKKVKEVTAMVRRDYTTGYNIMNKGYTEFNHRSVIEETNRNQKAFNSYVPPRSDDPDESWRAQTVRPIVRNKLISIAAHVTASIIYPGVFAQNQNDEEDKAAAEVMRMLIEHVINNSNYEREFVNSVIQALTDPATIIMAEWQEVIREVKRMKDDGTYTKEEMLDTFMSGWMASIVSIKELFISNIYESNIQKQRFLIRRKRIDYEDAKLAYGKYKNFKYVKPGVQVLYSDNNTTFYEQEDSTLNGGMVEEVTYWSRAYDLKLCFLNGVLITEHDAPNPRNDKLYPFAKGGYEPINNGNFFYYKSAANKLGPDEDMVNTLYNMTLDGTFLSLMPPMALYGNEEIGSSVMVPGTITSLRENSKMEAIGPRSDLRAGLLAIDTVEKSITESTQDGTQAGIGGDQTRTAREIATLQENAKIALGLFGKFIGFLVKDIGVLMIGDIVQNMTMAEINQLTSPEEKLKYRSFLVPNQNSNGKSVTAKIQFTEDTGEDTLDNSFGIMEEEGGYKSDRRVYKVNPIEFRKLRYQIVVSPEMLTPKNKNLEKALNLEAYDRMIANPLVDLDAVTRDFLIETIKPGTADKYMKKGQQPLPQQTEKSINEDGTMKAPKGVNNNMTGQLTGSNNLSSLMTM